MAPVRRRWRELPKQRTKLPCSPSPTDRLIHQISFSHHDSRLAQHSASENPPSIDLLHAAAFQPDSRFMLDGISHRRPQTRDEHWAYAMDEYLAASKLCREEAMACSLVAEGINMDKFKRKKNKCKSSTWTCTALNGSTYRALNVGTLCSWRALKKLLSRQFIPFSNRDHQGLHRINIMINTRSLKALSIEGRKMHFRPQNGERTGDLVHDYGKSQGNELNGNANKMASSIDAEACRSQLRRQKKNPNLQQGFKKKAHRFLSKASTMALEVCEILNLD